MRRKQKAQAAVEFALILPVLALLALGLLDLGRAFYFQETITNAAREGARFGATDSSFTTSEAANAAVLETGSLSGVSATASQGQSLSDGQFVTVTVTYNFTLLTPLIQSVVGTSSITLTATAKQPRPTYFTP